MNFEVFDSEEKCDARVSELRASGASVVIKDFNGRAYTIKWRD